VFANIFNIKWITEGLVFHFFVKAYSGGSGVEPNQIDFILIAVGFTMFD
jgi:hypothetical protein